MIALHTDCLLFQLPNGESVPCTTQMISVGEESGELDSMMMKIADTFDVDAKNTVDRMLAALVPVLTVVMTGMVAVIMMAILLPILSLSSSIQ